MQARSFIIDEAQVKNGQVALSSEDSHHLLRVLRAEPGDEIICKIPGKKVYTCTLDDGGKKQCLLRVVSEKNVPPKKTPRLSLWLSVPRPSVLDSLIPKMAELGLDNLRLVITQRSHLKKKNEIRLERFEKLVLESLKQSGRDELPVLEPVQTFDELLKNLDQGEAQEAQKILPWEEETGSLTLRKLPLQAGREKIFFIGPEGGIANVEAEALKARGFVSVRLTPNILKVETAALFTLVHLLPE
ncbi:MAG: 16S rRNA (uracil(1498)-N(3))-methyltransferase [Spirochaetia bacterium]|nr:16S rRNA (uracil(1498)-N(3))-methyltransferase [Spirochaetia bacterium]